MNLSDKNDCTDGKIPLSQPVLKSCQNLSELIPAKYCPDIKVSIDKNPLCLWTHKNSKIYVCCKKNQD